MTGARKVKPRPGLTIAALLLLKIRHERHWTQHQLASAIDVGRDTVSRWENGYAQPPVYLMARIRCLAEVA